MSKTRRAVLFDLDGTLVDSAPNIHAALNETLTSIGVKPLDLTTVKSYVGGGARRLVECALEGAGRTSPPECIDQLLERFLIAYRKTPASLSRLYPDASELLTQLSQDGRTLGVVTNKPHDLSLAILEALSIRHMFAAVAASKPGQTLKPAPALILAALEVLGIEAEQTVMVGDSRTDLEAARAAGCRIILVTHGYSREPVETLGADAVISHFRDLPNHL